MLLCLNPVVCKLGQKTNMLEINNCKKVSFVLRLQLLKLFFLLDTGEKFFALVKVAILHCGNTRILADV